MNVIRDEFTHRLLLDSGIEEGMHVLDVGCGTGDLSFMAAELVGDKGRVVGVDSSESALSLAKETAEERELTAVEFLQADITELPEGIGSFDAIIGRRVLMYLSDATHSIDKLLPHLKTSGKMIFQESNCLPALVYAGELPLHTKAQSWIWDTVEKEGGNIHIGMQLYSLMKSAGLAVSLLRSEVILHTYESGSDLGWVVGVMLSRITGNNVATAEEIEIDTLEGRLESELKASGIPLIRDMAFGICAQK